MHIIHYSALHGWHVYRSPQKHYYIQTDSDGIRTETKVYDADGRLTTGTDTAAEVGAGSKSPYLRQTRLTALRAFDTISHIVFAVNNEWVDMLQYFNWGLANFGYSRMTSFDSDFRLLDDTYTRTTFGILD